MIIDQFLSPLVADQEVHPFGPGNRQGCSGPIQRPSGQALLNRPRHTTVNALRNRTCIFERHQHSRRFQVATDSALLGGECLARQQEIGVTDEV